MKKRIVHMYQVERLNDKDIKEIESSSSEEVFFSPKYICIFNNIEDDSWKNRYKELLPYCCLVKTSDNEELYVAGYRELLNSKYASSFFAMRNIGIRDLYVHHKITKYQGSKVYYDKNYWDFSFPSVSFGTDLFAYIEEEMEE